MTNSLSAKGGSAGLFGEKERLTTTAPLSSTDGTSSGGGNELVVGILFLLTVLYGSGLVWAKGGDFEREISSSSLTLGGNARGIVDLCDKITARETYRHFGGFHYITLQGVLRDRPEIHIALVDSAGSSPFEVSMGSATLLERLRIFEDQLKTFKGWSLKLGTGMFVNGVRLQYQVLAKRKHSYRITHGLDYAERPDQYDWKPDMAVSYSGPLGLESILEILQQQEAIRLPYRFARLWGVLEPFHVETGGQEDITTTFSSSKKALEETPQLSMSYYSRTRQWKIEITDWPLNTFIHLFRLPSVVKQMDLTNVPASIRSELFVIAESSWTKKVADITRLSWTGIIWSYGEHGEWPEKGKEFSILAR